jgi:hypothetical protein
MDSEGIPGFNLQQSSNAALIEQRLRIEGRIKGSASWFFWIAVLSLINTAILMSGSSWHFIFGLGVTDIVTAIAVRAGGMANAAALFINFIIAGIFALLGFFGRKPQRWAFVVGMLLYGLDALLSLVFKDFLGVAFHGWVLYRIYTGFSAVSELNELRPEAASAAVAG